MEELKAESKVVEQAEKIALKERAKEVVKADSAKGRAARAEEASFKKAEQEMEKMTKAGPQPEPINYAELTKKLQAEWAEAKANTESMSGDDIKIGMTSLEALKFEPSFRLLADYLGLSATDISRYGNELSVILGWSAENTKGESLLDMLSTVRELKKSLGYQEVGETSVKKLYRYIRLISGEELAEIKEKA